MLIVACTSTSKSKNEKSGNELLLGETTIQVVNHPSSKLDKILFLNLHANETTSIETLIKYDKEHPIHYCYLLHDTTRRINFTIDNVNYSIDPNRIFTNKGRINTLKDGGCISKKARRSLEVFADNLLNFLSEKTTIVAVHNNTNDNYSILSYLPDGDESINTQSIYLNPEMDPDDFIYTTDYLIYKAMVKQNVNVILQDNKNCVDDGSLSVYCGKNKIRYVNIEAEQGHLSEQYKLFELVHKVLIIN